MELVTNSLVTPKKRLLGSSYQQFHNKPWAPFQNLRPFGTIGVITTKDTIQAKHKDKGTPMIYVGPAASHASDVHMFLNITTHKFIESRDITWMDQMYGDWKNLKAPQGESQITHLPIIYHEEDEPEPASSGIEPPSEPTTTTAKPPNDPHTRTIKALKQLEMSYNTEATTLREALEKDSTASDVPAKGEEPSATISNPTIT